MASNSPKKGWDLTPILVRIYAMIFNLHTNILYCNVYIVYEVAIFFFIKHIYENDMVEFYL